MISKICAGMAGLALVISAAACFSERGNATGPSAGACNVNLDPSQFGSTIIAIRSFLFQPTPVHVKAGNKVTWLNCEPAGTLSHTSTADGGAWASGLLDPGSTFTFVTATPGTFAYHCDVHPSMIAQVIVDP
jgi:plastocyanin